MVVWEVDGELDLRRGPMITVNIRHGCITLSVFSQSICLPLYRGHKCRRNGGGIGYDTTRKQKIKLFHDDNSTTIVGGQIWKAIPPVSQACCWHKLANASVHAPYQLKKPVCVWGVLDRVLMDLPGVGARLKVGLGVVGTEVCAGVGATIDGALPLESDLYTITRINRYHQINRDHRVKDFPLCHLRTIHPPPGLEICPIFLQQGRQR